MLINLIARALRSALDLDATEAFIATTVARIEADVAADVAWVDAQALIAA